MKNLPDIDRMPLGRSILKNCRANLRAAAIVVFKGPVEHCWVRKNLSFQPPHKVAVLLLADKDF